MGREKRLDTDTDPTATPGAGEGSSIENLTALSGFALLFPLIVLAVGVGMIVGDASAETLPGALAVERLNSLPVTNYWGVEVALMFLVAAVISAKSFSHAPRRLASVAQPYLGIRTLGVFGPAFSWRSAKDWGTGDVDVLMEVVPFLKRLDLGLLQILPFNLPLRGRYPYGIFSTFYLDPVYAGPETLLRVLSGLAVYEAVSDENIPAAYRSVWDLKKELDLQGAERRKEPKATLEQTRDLKRQLLKSAFKAFKATELGAECHAVEGLLTGTSSSIPLNQGSPLTQEFKQYIVANLEWLPDHSTYLLISQDNNNEFDFRKWSNPQIRKISSTAVKEFKESHQEEIVCEAFVQWIMTKHYQLLNKTAQTGFRKVDIMPDQFVAFGLADVWTNAAAFWIDQETLQMSYTQGSPPNRLDVPQHWLFPLLNFNYPAAKTLLLQRLRFFLQFSNVLRIDHLLGYYRAYHILQDPQWELTLGKMNRWEMIQEIFGNPTLSPEMKRDSVYELILSGLKEQLPTDIARKVFDDSGSLRHGHTVLLSRREFEDKEYKLMEHGWYRKESPEHGREVLFAMLNPNFVREENDYLSILIENQDLNSTDRVAVGFFELGLGEEIIEAMLLEAQKQGKMLVFESLGLVPDPINASLKQLNAPEMRVLYYGLQRFVTGQWNPNWVDNTEEWDVVTMSMHDVLPILLGWVKDEQMWNTNGVVGEFVKGKYYWRTDEQKMELLRWLQAQGYLTSAESLTVHLHQLTEPLLEALLRMTVDSPARIAIIDMRDVLISADDYAEALESILNMPGNEWAEGLWSYRFAVTVEELQAAAEFLAKDSAGALEGSSLNPIAVRAVRLLKDVVDYAGQHNGRYGLRGSSVLQKQLSEVSQNRPVQPQLLGMFPGTNTKPDDTSKEVVLEGEDSHILVSLYDPDARDVSLVIQDQDNTRRTTVKMEELVVESGLPQGVRLFEVLLPMSFEFFGVNSYWIEINGTPMFDVRIGLGQDTRLNVGWLIGVSHNTDMNPMSPGYGQKKA